MATLKMNEFKQCHDLNGMEAWHNIAVSLDCIGINDVLNTLGEMKREKEMKARQADEARKKAAAAERASRAVPRLPAATVTDTTAAANTTETSNSTVEADLVMVTDKDGKIVELNPLYQPGEKSVRDRDLQQKQLSLWPGTKAKGFRRGVMRNTQGRVFKNAA